MTRILSVFNLLKRVGFALLFCSTTAFAQPFWHQVGLNGQPVRFVEAHPYLEDVLFAAYREFGLDVLVRSADGGETWNPVIQSSPQFVAYTLSFNASEPNTIITSGRGTYWKSTDCGLTWQQQQTNLEFNPSEAVSVVYAADTPLQVVLHTQGLHFPSNIYISYDGGLTFDTTGGRVTGASTKFMSFPAHPGTIISLLYGPISTDGGVSWTGLDPDTIVSEFWDFASTLVMEAPLIGIRVQLQGPNRLRYSLVSRNEQSGEWEIIRFLHGGTTCAMHPNNPDIIAVSDSNGHHISFSEDGGFSWFAEQDDVIDSLAIADLSFSSDGTQLYLAAVDAQNATQRGLWRRDYITGITNSEESVSSFLLSVFPNPTNSVVTISFQSGFTESYEIAVSNILGQHIESIFIGKRGPGVHRWTWNASRQASGRYWITMKSENSQSVRALTIVR